MYVLRKSYGAYSAGTAVEQVADRFEIVATGHVVPEDVVTKRRSRTRTVKISNRAERKAAKQEAKSG